MNQVLSCFMSMRRRHTVSNFVSSNKAITNSRMASLKLHHYERQDQIIRCIKRILCHFNLAHMLLHLVCLIWINFFLIRHQGQIKF